MLTIRKAEAADADLVIQFIHHLADYEKLEGPSPEGEARIREHGWGAQPRFEVLLAFEDENPVGLAFYFFTYSTFAARPSLYLEDLFLDPEHRGKGYGKALLAALAREAERQECGRMDWTVLDWNAPALEFFQAQGAQVLPEWKLCRVSGAALKNLAEAASATG